MRKADKPQQLPPNWPVPIRPSPMVDRFEDELAPPGQQPSWLAVLWAWLRGSDPGR